MAIGILAPDGPFHNRDRPFDGAKAALFLGDRLLVLRRDDRPGLRWSGQLDFPGGGREGRETPAECLMREVREEVGLDLDAARWLHAGMGPASWDMSKVVWFFVIALPPAMRGRVSLGSEGATWSLLAPGAFLARCDAIASLQQRLRSWLEEADGWHVLPAQSWE